MQRVRTERGATAVEYALLAVAVAATVVAIVFALGLTTNGLFDTTCTNMTGEMGGTC